MSSLDRAIESLYGLAIGDALGMPTQLLSRAQVVERYGRLAGFEAAGPKHPIAAGLPAGSVTDDTEQALLLARHLIAHSGSVDAAEFARELVGWEDDMSARGSLDLLGPSTKAAVAAIADGVPVDQAGRFGTTNGAAMRVTPVGIATGGPKLIDRVVEASRVSHNTTIAICAATAVAAAVSAGVEGASVPQAITAAIDAAAAARDRGAWVAGADVSRRIEWATSLVDAGDPVRSLDDVVALVGTSLASQESVPAAFAVLSLYPDDAWSAVIAAASLGGDSDTIAAIVGAIAGACGATFPEHARSTVREVNSLELEPIAASLLELR